MSSEIYVLGCDVSKRTVDVALVDGQGVVQWTDKIANEVSTITTYFFTVGGALPDVTIRIAVEATGCYHYPVTESAVAAELGCIVYNPILTKQQIKGSVRGAKTDKTDAKEQLYKDLAVSAKGEVFARLQTIKGIGPYVAASLIGEIQDMTRFKTAKALTAYAGLDPRIRQSGHALNSTGRITKRGSSYLRRSIFLAANVARQHDPNLKAFYNKKRGEGKSYKVATIATARKLLTIVRAVWLSGQDYDEQFAKRG